MTLGQRALDRNPSRAEKVRSRRTGRKGEAPIHRPRKRSSTQRHRSMQYRYETTFPLKGRRRWRLPALPAIPLQRRIPTLLLLGIVAWQIMRWMTLPTFRVDQAIVNGSHYMSPSRVRAIAGVAGQSIFEVDSVEIKGRLEAIPEFVSAKVYVGWPNSVVINVTERQPVLEWDNAGEIWLVCADGLAFYRQEAVLGLIAVHSLTPVLDIGEPLQPVLAEEVIQAALTLSDKLGEEHAIFYDPDHGFGFQDDLGWTAYFGSGGNMDLKFRLYETIASQLSEMSFPARWVSVENPAIPHYR